MEKEGPLFKVFSILKVFRISSYGMLRLKNNNLMRNLWAPVAFWREII